MWVSNPFAFGAISFYPDGKRRVGGISPAKDRTCGYLFSDLVYDGFSEEEAMAAVEEAWRQLPAYKFLEYLNKAREQA